MMRTMPKKIITAAAVLAITATAGIAPAVSAAADNDSDSSTPVATLDRSSWG
jgi:hypothetical protein